MRKYWEFFKASYQITFSYRVGILTRLVRDVVMIIFFIVLWSALFKEQNTFQGFTLNSIVAYYIVVRILNQLYAFEPASLLSRDVRTGDLSNYLIKPLGYIKYLIFYTLGKRLARVILTILFAALIFIFAPTYLSSSAGGINMLAFLLSVILAWFLIFAFAVGVGTLSFWYSETRNIRMAFDSLTGILGGLWIPLNLFPQSIQSILNFLPFKYLFSFPVSIYQGKITGTELLQALVIQTCWLIVTFLAINWFLRRGVVKYEAYGK